MNGESKKVIKQLFVIGAPIVLQTILQTILPMIDQIMVGQLGDDAIALIGLSGNWYSVFFFILLAITGATSVYVAQYWGSQDLKMIPKILRIPVVAGIIFAALLIFVAFVFPVSSIKVYTNGDELALVASEFQKIYAISAIPCLLTNLYASFLRSTTRVKAPMVTGIIAVATNTTLNYVLMFVVGMGVKGAVWATLISRVLECLLLATYVHVFDKDVKINPVQIFSEKLEKSFMKKFYVTLVPLVLNNILFIGAAQVYNSFYGHMGTAELAAKGIADPVQSVGIGLFSGMAAATAVILGNRLGNGEVERAIADSKIILRFVLLIAIITSGIIALLSGFYLSFYKITPEVGEISQYFLYVMCVFLTVKIMNMVICQGVLQSGGDTKYILILNIIGQICVGIPLACLSFFVLHLPIYWMYALITMEEVVRVMLAFIKYKKNDWAKNLTENQSKEVSDS